MTPAASTVRFSAQEAAALLADLSGWLDRQPVAIATAPSSVRVTADLSGDPRLAAEATGEPLLLEPLLRVPVRQLDGMADLVGEIVLSRNGLESERKQLRDSLDHLQGQTQQLSDLGQRLRDLYERSLLEGALRAGGRGEAPWGPPEGPATAIAGFDALELDRFTAFHGLARDMIEVIVRLREATSDLQFRVEDPLDRLTRQLQQITLQLQEQLEQTRTVPFRELAAQFPRAVREVCRQCGKQAHLEIEGGDILIDKLLVQRLQAPMIHLINNALTHGIETGEQRRMLGKPAVGTLRLQAFRQGNRTVIQLSDDGAGIDGQRVRQKAIAQGLLTPAQAAALTERETYGLLFHPGFSTRDQADALAGRGVGLDVVRTTLQQLQGEVVTDSQTGQGTTFTLRLPLSLRITRALTVRCQGQQLAFPIDSVLESSPLRPGWVEVDSAGRRWVPWQEQRLALFPLAGLLRYPGSRVPSGPPTPGSQAVVILHSGDDNLALQVDALEGEQEIVIKSFSSPLPKPLGIAGASILGDGRILAIADVMELVDLGLGRLQCPTSGPVVVGPQAGAMEVPLVLVVDDSVTVREMLTLTLKRHGYQVEQAGTGAEALARLRGGLVCHLVLCDVEMPTMGGLELLERLRDEGRLATLPVALLTSRGSDRHRQIAHQMGAWAYFTKPFLEEPLMEALKRLLAGQRLPILGDGAEGTP